MSSWRLMRRLVDDRRGVFPRPLTIQCPSAQFTGHSEAVSLAREQAYRRSDLGPRAICPLLGDHSDSGFARADPATPVPARRGGRGKASDMARYRPRRWAAARARWSVIMGPKSF